MNRAEAGSIALGASPLEQTERSRVSIRRAQPMAGKHFDGVVGEFGDSAARIAGRERQGYLTGRKTCRLISPGQQVPPPR